MSTYFGFFALLKSIKPTISPGLALHHIETTAAVATDLEMKFRDLGTSWESGTIMDFVPLYTPEAHEVFKAENVTIDPRLIRAAVDAKPVTKFSMKNMINQGLTIKALVATIHDSNSGESKFYFQLSDKRHLLDKIRWYPLVYLNGHYSSISDHAITVSDNLSAFVKHDKSCLFRSHRDASQVLDLTAVFADATDNEIKSVLTCSNVSCDPQDINIIMSHCDDVSRKRFSMILKENVLMDPKIKISKVVKLAENFDIDIATVGTGKNQRIVFPTDRSVLKDFLKFLCQDYYHSILTGDRCVSNSHRKL